MKLGDLQAVAIQLQAHKQLAEDLRQPFYLYVNVSFRTMGAIFAGHIEEGERLAQEVLAIGQRLRGPDALGVFGVQMFTLRREQGRLQEVAAAVRHFVRMSPESSRWRPGLALIYSELAYNNEARAEFGVIAAHDLADIPRDGMWVTYMTYLAEVCAFLGDARRAALLYQALLPYAGRNKVALLEGSPAEPGLFTIRLKFPDGYRIAPRWHPAVERITVIAGTFHFGMGETFDQAKTKAFRAGSFVYIAPNMPRFAWAEGETVVQLAGEGPWGVTYLKPMNDPRQAKKSEK